MTNQVPYGFLALSHTIQQYVNPRNVSSLHHTKNYWKNNSLLYIWTIDIHPLNVLSEENTCISTQAPVRWYLWLL